MIPKVINYCWFGRNPKSDLITRCIKSWHKYCPDYEIIEWNEDNFDISINSYVKEAYEAGKWAFVTDYARLWIIYHYGGIYLDTDVELIKNLDSLLNQKAYFGFEDTGMINTGLGFAAEKHNTIIKMMMDSYKNISFKKNDGSFDLLPCPVRNTNSIKNLLPPDRSANCTLYLDEATIYSSEYFCPLSADGSQLKKTDKTFSIHWFSATWLSKEESVVHEYRVFRNRCQKRLGKTLGNYIVRIVYLFKPQKRKILKKY